MMKNEAAFIENLIDFIKSSPTSYHAALNGENTLIQAGFESLDFSKPWNLKGGGKYVLRKEGSLIAFQIPLKKLSHCRLFASHTDSPALKLKPHAEIVKEEMALLGVEVYGGPLLNSWFNRDLGIAGKIVYLDKKEQFKEAYINLNHSPLVIPQLAIHLDRKVNEEGLQINKQEHLYALAGIPGIQDKAAKLSVLETLIADQIPLKELIAHDLFLYPLEEPRTIGFNHQFLSSYRIDSLVSVFSILEAFKALKKGSQDLLNIMALWDHEEIGSKTAVGVESPFFIHTFERITLSLGLSREEFLRMQNGSLCISVDLGHAVHPNYPEKHDPQHKPKLGQGVLIKTNAQKKYATDVSSARFVIETARKNKIPYQFIASRNDIVSGSTIGPLHAALTGISTVDIGIGQLSMHSTRELVACEDIWSLSQLIKYALAG